MEAIDTSTWIGAGTVLAFLLITQAFQLVLKIQRASRESGVTAVDRVSVRAEADKTAADASGEWQPVPLRNHERLQERVDRIEAELRGELDAIKREQATQGGDLKLLISMVRMLKKDGNQTP